MTKAIAISPVHRSNSIGINTLVGQIEIFEARILGWYLDWSYNLAYEKHAGFASLHIAFSYFEMINSYLEGKSSKNNSKYHFEQGLLNVFPEINGHTSRSKTIDTLYNKGRCGFYHDGQARQGLIIYEHTNPITFYDNNLYVDQKKFIERIKGHFHGYISDLKKEKEPLITNFKIRSALKI